MALDGEMIEKMGMFLVNATKDFDPTKIELQLNNTNFIGILNDTMLCLSQDK